MLYQADLTDGPYDLIRIDPVSPDLEHLVKASVKNQIPLTVDLSCIA